MNRAAKSATVPGSGPKAQTSNRQSARPQSRQSSRRQPPPFRLLPGSRPALPSSKDDVSIPRLVISDAGKSWLQRYLNPNGHQTSPSANGRIPDGTVAKSGVFNIHQSQTWSCPFAEAKGVWSLYVVSTNYIGMQYIVVAQYPGKDGLTDAESAAMLLVLNGADVEPNTWYAAQGVESIRVYCSAPSEFKDYLHANDRVGDSYSYDFIQLRQTYKGDTFRFTGSTLNDQGSCTSAKFPVDIDVMDYTQTNEKPDDYIDQKIERAINARLRARSDLVTDTNTEEDTVDTAINLTGSSTKKLHSVIFRTNVLSVPPLAKKYITQCDPRAHDGVARDGCYTINYNRQEDFPWQMGNRQRFTYFRPIGVETVKEVDGLKRNFDDIPCTNFDMSITMFNGIDTTASITQESRCGVEYVPQPSRHLVSLQDTAHRYDPVSLKVARAVAINLKSAYTAAYNDWGKLWSVIKGVIPHALSFVPGIGPHLGHIANWAIPHVEKWFK